MSDILRICNRCSIPVANSEYTCPVCGTTLDSFDSRSLDSLEGLRIDSRYVLEEFIAQGSMSVVYRALHDELGSSVAVKILKPSIAIDENILNRFKQEARIMGNLNHPNIMGIITSGESSGGLHYMVSEYIRGSTLEDYLIEGIALPVTRAVSIVSQLLSALSEAHSYGFIHRDLKPSNIVIISLRGGGDVVKLVDFGISTVLLNVGKRITNDGELIGTPEYMAPEVINGQRSSIHSDIYSLGVMFYRMLTGRMPFSGSNAWEILNAHLRMIPKRPSLINPALCDTFDIVILKALEKNPTHRIQSAEEFSNYINEIMQNLHISTTEDVDEARNQLRLSRETARLEPEKKRRPARTVQIRAVESENKPVFNVTSEHDTNIDYELTTDVHSRFIKFFSEEESTLCLCGEEGAGKSHIIKSMLTLPELEGVNVIDLSFDPYFCARPWYPVLKMIEKMAGVVEDSVITDKEKSIRRWINHIGVSIEDINHVMSLYRGTLNERLMERAVKLREILASLAQVVFAVAARTPSLFIFRSYERYDFPSRHFIEYISNRSHGKPVKIVVTSNTPLEFASVMKINPMTEQDLRIHVLRTLTRKSDSIHTHLEKIRKFNCFNPVLVDEAIRYLLEGGRELPQNHSDIVKLRLANINSQSLRILQLVAICGIKAPLDLIWAREGSSRDTIYALSVLIKRNLLYRDGNFVHFYHPMISKIILSTIPKNTRDSINEFILRYLKQTDASIFRLVRHYLLGNDIDKSIESLQSAARICETSLDDYGSIVLYRRAHDLAQIDALSGRNQGHFVEICSKLGDLLMFTGEFREAEKVFREGLLFADGYIDLEVSILSSMARMTSIASKTEEKARTLINQAIKKASSTKNPELIYKAYFDLSYIELKWERWEEGAEYLKEGIEMIRKNSSNPDSFWRLYIRLSEFEFAMGNHQEAVEILMSSIATNRNQYSPLAIGRTHYQAGYYFLKMGQTQDAKVHFNIAINYLTETGDRMGVAQASLAMAEVHSHREREPFIRKALSLSEQIGWIDGLEKASRLALGA
ncbi:protein kinase [Myxococcota bacterium]|nr:protein kinase [Myxococcota bacterium]MBU1381755.1 protein kinase [Myxococcota bacterium]MBU1496406.1 protein kinase [Myxococcota bacterium]